MAMALHNLEYNLYASLVFGLQREAPVELPNVKSVKWSRGVDTDIATGTIEFYNTAPQVIGTVFHPDYGLDNPGFYSFTRGATSYSSRSHHRRNQWHYLLVPDNILRTYEGYGFDASVCPDNDPHLVQSGVWMIKDVELTATGLITCTVEDLAGILRDQVCFYPVIPKNFYPLTFTAEPKQSGFFDGYTYSTETALNPNAGYAPSAGWTGPTAAPSNVTVDDQPRISWTPPATPPAGYKILGYDIFLDNVHVGQRLSPATRSFAKAPVVRGNVYLLQVAAVYLRISTGVDISGQRNGGLVRPHLSEGIAVVPGSIQLNVGPPPSTGPTVPVLGSVSWKVTGDPAAFMLIRYDHGRRDVFAVPGGSGSPRYFDTGQGDLTGANFLIYPYNQVGFGAPSPGRGEYFASNGAFYAPPQGSVEPRRPSPPAGPTVTTKTGVTRPLSPVQLALTYSDNSNGYYVGHGEDVSVYGHTPKMALDGKDSTYWLSIGNERRDQGYSYEWWQGSLAGVELTEVHILTALTDYFVYISVFAYDAWVAHKRTDVIPYDPKNPQSHNGANIPYVTSLSLGGSQGPHKITLPTPVKGATKVRVTFHNLQDFGVGSEPYRAGLRAISCYGVQNASTSTASRPPVAKPPAPRPVLLGSQTNVAKSSSTYVPPMERPGAGAQPGYYEDYTDIVKLFCAWGGFYWPYDATLRNCDGTSTTFGFGVNNLGLNANDPVLGDQSAGRVWGDFANTGTAGITMLPIPQWDKKSLLEGISYVRDIIGFVFYIDEEGAVVWRLPNWFTLGNYVGDRAAGASRVSDMVTIEESQTLMELHARFSSRNVRERYFIAGTDGVTGALSRGYNPNPIGLRRIGGWTDQHFGSNAECKLMADLIALRALMSYHKDTLQIPGYPRIQVDDQVRIYERVTGEDHVHYVEGISSSNDLESGVWTYDLNTQWLGEDPASSWAFASADFSSELQNYLDAAQALGLGSFAPPPSAGAT